MAKVKLDKPEIDHINRLVDYYIANKKRFDLLAENLLTLVTKSTALEPFIHSIKWRVKEPDHLKTKLKIICLDAKKEEKPFRINEKNLFRKINDLAGLRILHLHTSQFKYINKILIRELNNEYYNILEGPIANTWDDEYREYFKSVGVKTKINPRMYTSVHYVIEPNSRIKSTGEIQIRTLAEEIWGEVDHTINYPKKSSKLTCREQIKVLARVTSSCTRLVDSIFEANKTKGKK